MNITDGDTTYTVTYRWPGDASTVKGFPYMKVDPSRLPVQLWNISSLDFSAQWRTYVIGTEESSIQEQTAAYDNTALRVNQALDMFLSEDALNSTGVGAPIEIMIWLWYTPTMQPLGHTESTPEKDTVEIAGTNFSLYNGWNAQGQHVFSWLAHENTTSTNADYGPLLRYIWEDGQLSGSLYVGQLEFGSELMHAGEETVFEARNYTLKITRDGDPDAPVRTTSATSLPTATSTVMSNTRTVSSSHSATASVAVASTPSNASSRSLRNSSRQHMASSAILMLTTYLYGYVL
jgi:hypothetical protein